MAQVLRIIIVGIAVSCFTACASGYKQFYRPAQGMTAESISTLRAAPPTPTPRLERAQPGNPQAVTDAYAKRGYIVIGTSLFNSGQPETDKSALSQGQKVGADLVLILDPRYTGSITSSVPITTPTTTRSYSSGTATAYGPGGSATAYGTGQTTTYGSTTTYVPMTTHRSDYGAVYFIKQKFGFGAFSRDLSDAERQELQTNRGAVIRLVVDNTPAFDADMLIGDVITTLDGVPVANAQSFNSLLRERRGKQVTVSFLRRGQKVEKVIQLNQ